MTATASSAPPRTVFVGKVSGGVGSYSAVRRHVDRRGTDGLVLLFTDTLCEDQDAYRFLILGAANLYGASLPDGLVPAIADFPPWEDRSAYKSFVLDLSARAMRVLPGLRWLSDGRDPWDVYEDERFLGNSRADPCSKILRRRVADRWLRENCDPGRTEVIVGIDYEEIERFDGDGRKAQGLRGRMAEAGWTFTAPLCEAPYLSWLDRRRRLRDEGLWLPRLNAMGFSHNNCFAADERLMTDNGVRSFREVVGKSIRVIGNESEWTDATVESFGEQELASLTLSRHGREKTIRTTHDHRWLVREGRHRTRDETTGSLVVGDVIPTLFCRSGPNLGRPVDGSLDHGGVDGWHVASVEVTGDFEEVFCAVVPDGHVFALADNVMTGNCGGHCCKGGQGHWRLMLKTFPERYAYAEERERLIRVKLGDVSMLTDRRGDGEKRPLTLEALRKRDPTPEELADMGACGCFFGDAA